MKLRLFAFAMLLSVVSLLGVTVAGPQTTAHAASARSGALPVQVNEGAASGIFTINRFQVVNGVLTAVGTYTGTAANGSAVTDAAASAPVVLPNTASGAASTQQTTAGCNILHLVVGPIFLNLLGLQVTTNQIVVDITAVPGAGNLLGNLLCAVANLLNGGTGLTGIANLLNQILGILQGLTL